MAVRIFLAVAAGAVLAIGGGDGGTILVLLFLGYLFAQTFGGKAEAEWVERWQSAADELGFTAHIRPKKRTNSSMRGELNGHHVRVVGFHDGDPEIEVRFESGFQSLDIERRQDGEVRKSNKRELVTGDVTFDERFRVAHRSDANDDLLRWLNGERREIISVLDDALTIVEIEEDELEVKLGRTEWTSSDLVQAVELCVLVAQVLDRSHRSIQDKQRLTKADPQDRSPHPVDDFKPSNIQDEIRDS